MVRRIHQLIQTNFSRVCVSRSQDFHNFLKACLEKDPDRRPAASDLLKVKHAWRDSLAPASIHGIIPTPF